MDGKTEAMYLFKFRLGGYFHDQLLNSARMASSYVIEFDESMNPKTCQMDFHVRFWYNGQMDTFYYGSSHSGMLEQMIF